MRLKDIESDIMLMEQSIRQCESINKEIVDIEHQVEHVCHDLQTELHTMNTNLKRNEARRAAQAR